MPVACKSEKYSCVLVIPRSASSSLSVQQVALCCLLLSVSDSFGLVLPTPSGLSTAYNKRINNKPSCLPYMLENITKKRILYTLEKQIVCHAQNGLNQQRLQYNIEKGRYVPAWGLWPRRGSDELRAVRSSLIFYFFQTPRGKNKLLKHSKLVLNQANCNFQETFSQDGKR